MIIFGTRGITYRMAAGRFACPSCGPGTGFTHRRVRRFFTLYFIPVIPLDQLVRVRPRAPNSGHRGRTVLDARIEPRALRKRTARVALHEPQVGAHRTRQDRRVVDQPGIDALHRDDDSE